MTVEQVSWLLLLLALVLFVVLFILEYVEAARANKRFLKRVKGRKRRRPDRSQQ